MTLPGHAVVMKAGVHAAESWEGIVARKQAEEIAAGATYWGYGGTLCHPRTQVQPFSRSAGEPIAVLMIRTPSDFLGPPTLAEAISEDGTTWDPVPEGAHITGSKYALVLRGLRRSDQVVDLGAYEVAIGPKSGTPLSQYLRSRVDKACVRLADIPGPPWPVQLVLRAELIAPYAVFLRDSPG